MVYSPIGGDTLDAMASAVENAAVVVVCLTENYQRSPNCRAGKSLSSSLVVVVCTGGGGGGGGGGGKFDCFFKEIHISAFFVEHSKNIELGEKKNIKTSKIN